MIKSAQVSGKTRVRIARGAAALLLLVVAVVGCVQWQEFKAPVPPNVTSQWRELIEDLRAFEKRIGFSATKNFQSLTGERQSFPFCGQTSRYALPYSYEDPSIRWLEAVTEGECHAESDSLDVYYGSVEAMGEIGTPVTPAMVSGKLDRFVYLVIHEDCHDQFDLPYGVEEALCNVITYHGMAAFSKEKFRWFSREGRAIRNYTGVQSRQTRATVLHYDQVHALYARFSRSEISADDLLAGRAAVFASAEQALELQRGTLNNVILANYMTYSRHYPVLERIFDVLGKDLARTVAFFRQVDRTKPAKAEVLKRIGMSDESSVEFVRAYETAVIETAQRLLAEQSPKTR